MQARSNLQREKGNTIAFVPTMGFLHEGHLSLLREGKKHGNDLILSIFVNPTQFGENEDLDAYPRNLERDLDMARKEGVDAVFTPVKDSIYGDAYQTYVTLEQLPNYLCGISRPVHFRGVATVVTKLFNIVKPHVAVFGQKDFQQLAVIRQMTRDLNFDIKIIGAPTVREHDGLAMSSRNTYLSDQHRVSATLLYKSLQDAQAQVQDGETSAFRIIETATATIQSCGHADIDYISICDPDTLNDMDTVEKPALMALAVKFGETRLLDNMVLKP